MHTLLIYTVYTIPEVRTNIPSLFLVTNTHVYIPVKILDTFNCYRTTASAVGCTESNAHPYGGPEAGQGVYLNPEPFTQCIPILGWGDRAGSLCIYPKWVTTSRQGGEGRGIGERGLQAST